MSAFLNVTGKRALIVTHGDGDGDDNAVALNAAHGLLRNGCKVVIAGDSTNIKEEFRKMKLSDEGKISTLDLHTVHVDLTKPTQKSVGDATEMAWSVYDGFDLLLLVATFTGPLTPFLETSSDQMESSVNINFKSSCLFSIAVGKRMKEAGTGGSIVFITSIAGTERGLFPGAAIAGASIAAVNYLTRAMAMELGKYKIRVNAIARGLVKSDPLLKDKSVEILDKEGDRIIPLKRWVDEKTDLNAMIMYLAADTSSFITGTVVFVDGGQSLVRPRMRSYL